MLSTLHDDLSRALEAVRARDRLRFMRDSRIARLTTETQRYAELRKGLEAERKDVARLEGLSLERLLASIAGRLEPTLAEERRQADVAELAFVEQERLVATVAAEVADLDGRIAALGDVDGMHRAAMDAKARLIVERGDEQGRLVVSLSERIAELNAAGCELREALEHGHALAASLTAAAKTLDQVVRKGVWDIWIGGSMATAEKHRLLDVVSRDMQRGALQYERFRKELFDVGRGVTPYASFLSLGAPLSKGERFCEHVFGAIANGHVQERIRGVAHRLGIVRQEVHRALEELARAYDDGHRQWQALRTQLEATIVAG